MAITVVSTDLGDRQGTVTVQGDSQEEVMSAAAKQAAITAATKQITRAGVSGNEVAYPVDCNGETSDDLILGRNGTVVAAYRCDYNITGGL